MYYSFPEAQFEVGVNCLRRVCVCVLYGTNISSALFSYLKDAYVGEAGGVCGGDATCCLLLV